MRPWQPVLNHMCPSLLGTSDCSAFAMGRSGRHPKGSRTRSNGYRGKSNWPTTTAAELRAREELEVLIVKKCVPFTAARTHTLKT